jgi:protein SCO1/2
MAAMTMPFKVGAGGMPAGIQAGQRVRFELHVSADASWVDQIRPTGQIVPLPAATVAVQAPLPLHSSLLDAPFTNELGQRVTLADFHGQALAITFFYTRCPLPDYCPRLSRNFQEASERLAGRLGLPANWHFLSVTFDPVFDTPDRLRSYGQTYGYDPAHWSFLSGSPEIIAGLAHSAGVQYTPGGGTIDHNFRTLIVDTSGHLQMVFPTGGNLSDQIAAEMVKALAATNAMAISSPQNRL